MEKNWLYLACILMAVCFCIFAFIANDYFKNTEDALVLKKINDSSGYSIVVSTDSFNYQVIPVSEAKFDTIERFHIVTVWDSDVFGVHIVKTR